ncbi:MAG TPA: sigma-70 family RNA polymerase sigma factor [Thermoleophilaceae bacterium]|nr:sigma-70 family RNA polymerase sigma factor [Thermoleophilaceae bacterium]
MSTPPDLSDELRRFAAGDSAAAEALARHASRLALRTAAVIVGSRDEAADVAQEVAIDVLGSVAKLREPAALDAWVHRITVRHAMRLLRRRGRARAVELPLALIGQADEPTAPEGPDRAALLTSRGALAAGLARLPARQRLALALRYVHDLSDEQIAQALGCRVGTAHALLSRGRAALRSDPQLAELAPQTAIGDAR